MVQAKAIDTFRDRSPYLIPPEDLDGQEGFVLSYAGELEGDAVFKVIFELLGDEIQAPIYYLFHYELKRAHVSR